MIVLTGSANSVIHSVMVDVLERCVFDCCFYLHQSYFIELLARLVCFFTGSFQLYHVYTTRVVFVNLFHTL